MLERETGLPVAGFLPSLPDCALESRHLGLVAPEELPGFREKAAQDGLPKLLPCGPVLGELPGVEFRVAAPQQQPGGPRRQRVAGQGGRATMRGTGSGSRSPAAGAGGAAGRRGAFTPGSPTSISAAGRVGQKAPALSASCRWR